MAERQPLVVLENSTIEAMANNPAIVRELPFLTSLRAAPGKKRGCGTCGGNINNRSRADTMTAAKRLIAGLDPAKKQFLKQHLNTRGIRLVYRNSNNQIVQHTF